MSSMKSNNDTLVQTDTDDSFPFVPMDSDDGCQNRNDEDQNCNYADDSFPFEPMDVDEPTTCDGEPSNASELMDIDEFEPPMRTSTPYDEAPFNVPSGSNQYGGGPPVRPPPDIQEATPNMYFPTPEELEYLDIFATIRNEAPPRRLSDRIVHCPDNAFVVKNLDRIPCTLNEHLAKLFDIFIRLRIQNSGRDLTKSKYWLSLSNIEGCNRSFYVHHETYLKATGTHVINRLALLMQSNKEMVLDDGILLSMFVFRPAESDGGCVKGSIPSFLGHTRQVLAGSYCLPISLLIGRLFYEPAAAAKKLFRTDKTPHGKPRDAGRVQIEEARALLARNGINDDTDGVFGRELIEKLAATEEFSQYRIYTFVKGSSSRQILQSTDFPVINPNAPKAIAIYYDNGHYEAFKVTNHSSAKKHNTGYYYCDRCQKLLDTVINVRNHASSCDGYCRKCGRFDCKELVEPGFTVVCEDCKTTFKNPECFENHFLKEKGPNQRDRKESHCEKYAFCATCGRKHNRKDKHVCDSRFCSVCGEMRVFGHQCEYAAPTATDREKALARQNNYRFFFYDFESIVASSSDAPDENQKLGPAHEPNVVCGQFICAECPQQAQNSNELTSCQSCGQMVTFKYDDATNANEIGWPVVKRFANFIRKDSRFDQCILLAHNGGKYDHNFVLPVLTELDGTVPSLIMDGNRIIQGAVTLKNGRKVIFKDTLNFLPMALKQMPAAFGFEDDLVKGTFPYMFNHPDRYGKILPTYPAKEYFQPNYMSPKDKQKFDVWYEEHKNKEYDFDKEILAYCKSDVKILVKAIRKYIEICAEIFKGWNPIVQTSTLASFVMFVLKHEHIKSGVIGFIPERGFPARNNSILALKYLQWLDELDPSLRLQHSLNKGEKKITHEGRSFFVDGYCEDTKTVYEIHGCMWHGCPICFPDGSMKNPCCPGYTFNDLYKRTREREDFIKDRGYNLVVKWECEIKADRKKDKKMDEFFAECRHTSRLHPRESMFGGRTQPFQALAKADDRYTIEYYDYCSLYPWTNMQGAFYPIGQPKVITQDFKIPTSGELLEYRGVVFCDVLPPNNLDFPVLPYRANSKLLFPLCRTCATESKGGSCTHTSEKERYLTGCWVTEELNHAIKKGYVIKKIHEAWHWADEKWFKGGFFSSFLEPLLRLKHEASGWPKPNMTDEEKQRHIAAIAANDKVEIRSDKIVNNPALRQTAKLFLNSAWGKFAQNPRKAETIICGMESDNEITAFLEDPAYEPKHFGLWGEDHVLMSRMPRTETLMPSKYSNIVYGSITTAVARLRLYEAMERVGAENLIYCDTDSVIFKQRIGEDLLGDLRGDGLGMLTNEMKAGSRIVEVVTLAPKVYALKMEDAKGTITYSIKAKGMTLNCETSESITFENMKQQMVDYMAGKEVEPLLGVSNTIKSSLKRPGEKISGRVIKRMRPVDGKGYRDGNRMLPYGQLPADTKIVEDYNFDNR